MLVDRRKFLNLAAANTVVTSIYPLDAEKRNAQSPTKSATMFAFQQVDVFSPKPLLGNPLAVVVGADALSNEQMSAFANWTNLSETTFLLEPRSKAADYRVRIFNPDREVASSVSPVSKKISPSVSARAKRTLQNEP